MNKSLATINSPEFINLTPLDINPLMSACEIKVLYVGENRNHSFISKEVATEMAKTLRGAPIVGYWRQEVEDFGDHGQRVTLDVDGVKFECLTKPYGFVSPDARVWFQEFEDQNDFGESITREYLMTTGYLWTGQFEECSSAVEGEGKPHSMELDSTNIKGHWETNSKGMDFFIINDATFSKLCILGEDVEPCFEGSSVTAPNISASFAKVDDTFTHTLYNMMQEFLQFALKGGQQMDDNKTTVVEGSVTEEPETPVIEEPIAASEHPEGAPCVSDSEPEFAKKDEDEDKNDDKKDEPKEEEPKKEDDEEDEDKKKYELLSAEHATLQESYSNLQGEYSALVEAHKTLKTSYDKLVEFKNEIDDANKDRMIESFSMLSDEEKKDVIANKANYTVEDIEEKLSVICFRKGNFDLNNSSKNNNNKEEPITTFNYGATTGSSKPDWLKAVDNVKNN